jgi:5-oxoprolinase (ATP-hydrolysing) subunit A
MNVFVDINCDTGEGIGNEAAIMPFITSANIACGFHAGDEAAMREMVALCLQHGVKIGAHPSFPDRENFGRVDSIAKGLKPEAVAEIVSEQLFALQKICNELGATLHHVKPHGALYNRAAWDEEVAAQVCKGIKAVNPQLIVFGLSGSKMSGIAAQHGLFFLHEVFADRTYQDDGSLTLRSQANALITDEAACLAQAQQMISENKVTTVSGKQIPIQADTLCIHGDGPHAITFATVIHTWLHKRESL